MDILAAGAVVMGVGALGILVWAFTPPRDRIVSREDERINARLRAERRAREERKPK